MKTAAITRFVRSLDDFGHPIRLNYRGENTYQSCLGGSLSIVTVTLTLFMVISGIRKVVLMLDPNVTTFLRPVSTEERDKFREKGVNFAEYDFNIAF